MWANQLHLDIAPTLMRNPDGNGDVLHLLEVVLLKQLLRYPHGAREASCWNDLAAARRLEYIHSTIRNLDGGHINPRLWLDSLPAHSGVDIGDTVEGAPTILVAVSFANRSDLPVGIFGVDFISCQDTKVLQVTPVEIRPMGRTLVRIGAVCETTYRTLRARANTPAALGAAAEVPPWLLEHLFFPTSVVVYAKVQYKLKRAGLVITHNVGTTARRGGDNHVGGT